MADPVRLDTRPRRKDLTSRECSSIIGGVIGGMIDAWGIETTRDLVRMFAKILRGDVSVAFTAEAAALELRPGCRTKAATEGLVWWAEHTDAEWVELISASGGLAT